MSSGSLNFSISLADFLATAVSDGDWDDVLVTAKIDDPALGSTPATQIKDFGGQLWANVVDDMFLATYQGLYKAAKIWSVADAPAKLALGSDDALAVNDLLFQVSDKTLWYCTAVTGGSTSTWSSIAALGDVTGPGASTPDAAARFDGATGKLLKDSLLIISNTGALSGITTIALSGTVDGRDVSADGTALDAHIADMANPHTTSLAQTLAAGDMTSGNNIDITAGDSLTFNENVSVPGGAPGAGEGKVWVKNDAPNTLWFTDDTNVDHQLVTGAGTGDVVGPGASTDNALVRFDGATGLLIQDSTALLSDGGDLTITGDIFVTGNVDGVDVSTHATRHENGGADEISVLGLSGLLADGQTPLAHAASHENGGGDEISVLGLSGLLADGQTPLAHAASHENGGGDEISVLGLSGLLADAQTPIPTAGADTTAIHDNVAAEISAITNKAVPIGADFLVIEDSAAANVKKHILISALPAAYPLAHGESHEDGQPDEISVQGLSGLLADAQTPIPTAGADTTAIHDNVASEISAVTLKATPVSGDFLLIEDSAAANVKKRITIGTLPAGAASTLAATLAVGNTTGGTDIQITNGDDIIGTPGVGANGGAIVVTSGAATTGVFAGGAFTATAGAGSASGIGGGATLKGGEGGATGTGGAVTVTGGLGGATSGTGGYVIFRGGAGQNGNALGGYSQVIGGAGHGSGLCGSALLTGGTSTSSGAGGTAVVEGGKSISGGAGDAFLLGGTVTAGGGAQGAARVIGGGGSFAQDGGHVWISGGVSTGTGGTVTIDGGNGTNLGGATNINGGDGNFAGSVNITGGTASTSANVGGAVFINGGFPGSTGHGGGVTISSGWGGATSGNSGDISITPGPVVSGTAGAIRMDALKVRVDRMQHDFGTALVSGDFALSAGWGTTASISSITGTDSRFIIEWTSTGTGQATSPTLTFTYKDGAWPNAPFPMLIDNGSTHTGASYIAPVFELTTRSTTQAVWTLRSSGPGTVTTPVSTDTWKAIVHVMG